MYIYDNISLNSSDNEKYFRQCSVNIPQKSRQFGDNVEKYGTARHTIDDKMAQKTCDFHAG